MDRFNILCFFTLLFSFVHSNGPRYEGCFVNQAPNRINGYVGHYSVEDCANRADGFFGMEFPQGTGIENAAECLPLNNIPNMVKVADSDCEQEKDSSGRRLGNGHRLAVYSTLSSNVFNCKDTSDSWTDWGGQGCDWYRRNLGECNTYNNAPFHEGYPAMNPCCACNPSYGMIHGIEEVEITGSDNLIFVGHFPELKLCEGSSNVNEGSSACCVILGIDDRAQTMGRNCASTTGRRRELSECPEGSFNVATACAEHGEFCHAQSGESVNECAGCDLCNSRDYCPECPEALERRLLIWNHAPLVNPLPDHGAFSVHPGIHVLPGPGSEARSIEVMGKKLKVDGDRNLVFIGDFPQLKMCEGSGNSGAGQVSCCVSYGRGQSASFHGNCAKAAGRRFLSDTCPSGTFDLKTACQEREEFCHASEGAISGCLDCQQCHSSEACPECANRKL